MSTEGPPSRLVLDTNLMVARVFRPSAPGPAGVLALWESGAVEVCVSPAVLREMESTLGRLPDRSGRRDALLDRLRNPDLVRVFDPVPDSGWRCNDPSDDKFLHLALAADADALVTSDRALLEVHGFPVPILKSGQWLRHAGRSRE